MKYLSKSRGHRRTPVIEKILNTDEYINNEKFKLVQCELAIEEQRINRSELSALKYLVFKVRTTGTRG